MADTLVTSGLPLRQRQGVMACVLVSIVLSTLDSAVANIALPTLARDLAVSEASTVWVVNSYQLAVAVALLPAAALGEIMGFRRVFTAGVVVFGLASLSCALSPSLPVLVAARAAQGLGGACLAALGPALVRTIYSRREIGSGIALVALAVAMSGALGPSVAAAILSVAAWPWLFLVNLPLCILVVPLFWRLAPADIRRDRPFDRFGALLSALAIGVLVIGVNMLGSRPGPAVLAIAASLACSAVLIRQQMRRADPILPLDLLRIPVFALSAATSVCSFTAQILAYLSLPFLFETVMQRSATATGLLMTPWPLLVAVSAPVAGRLSKRYPAVLLGTIGLGVLAAGLGLLAAMPARPGDWDICWRMGVCGVGFGFFQTPNNLTLMTSAPVERSGAAGGVAAVARTVGWCIGSALVAVAFAIWQPSGTTACLATACGLALAGAVVSGARLLSVRTS